MYTDEAKIEQKVIRIHYPSLWEYYIPTMGNFMFTPREFKINITAITRWMLTFEGYRVVIEECDEGEKFFFLTNI